MKYLMIVSVILLLAGCKSITPVSVEQHENTRKDLKEVITIVAGLTGTEEHRGSQINYKAVSLAENFEIEAPESGFDLMGETIIGLVMTTMGLGGVAKARKLISVAGNKDPEEFNKKK